MNEDVKKKLMIWGGGGVALLLLALAFRSRNSVATVTPIVSGDVANSGNGGSTNDASMYFAQYAKESQQNMLEVVKAINESNAGLREDYKNQNEMLVQSIQASNTTLADLFTRTMETNTAATTNAIQQMAGGMTNLMAQYDPRAFFGTLQGQLDSFQSQLNAVASSRAVQASQAPSGAGTVNQSVAPSQDFYNPVSRQPTGYDQNFQQSQLAIFQQNAQAQAQATAQKNSGQPVVSGTVVSITDKYGNTRPA